MKEIPLTRGMSAIVDDDCYKILSSVKWYAAKQPDTFYACRDIRSNGKKKTLWMHRVINNTPDGMVTDHKNGDGLDNRRENLRSVSHQDNMINCARRRSKNRYRGVSWHILNKVWVAQITVDRKNVYIGSFPTEEIAKEAYDAARKEFRKNKIIRKD